MQRHWSDSMFVWTCILLLLKLVMLHVCVWITSCCNNDRVPFSWLTHSLMTHRRLWSVATTLHDVHAPLHSATCFQLVVVQSPICCVHVFWGRPGSLRQFVPEQRPAKLHDSQCRNVFAIFWCFWPVPCLVAPFHMTSWSHTALIYCVLVLLAVLYKLVQ